MSRRNRKLGRSARAEQSGPRSKGGTEVGPSSDGPDSFDSEDSPDAPDGTRVPLWRQVRQFHVVLAVGAFLMIDSLAVMAQGGPDAVAPMWVPILSGAVLSFGTFLFTSGVHVGQQRSLTQPMLVGSILLAFVVAVLYLVHLFGAHTDPLAVINPWGYSLALATIALPILASDVRHWATPKAMALRLTLALLVPLGVIPIGLLISPAVRVVAASLSLAAFLLLVDALLKATSGLRHAPETPSSTPGQPGPAYPVRTEVPKAREQANLNSIFDTHQERMNLHDDLMERALVVSHGIDDRRPPATRPFHPPEVAPPQAPPKPVASDPEPPPVRLEPAQATHSEENSQGPIYFTAGDETPGRVSTGIERLDMLLKGGFPSHSQAAVIGPIFIGKEVVLHTFIAAGLARGEQALIVTSSRGPTEVSKALSAYLPNFDALSRSGHVQWVDAFAGDTARPAPLPHMTVVAGPGDYEGILSGVAKSVAVFRGTPFRVAYISLSNSLMQADERKAFDFLRSLQTILRGAEATTAYAVDSGVMDDRQLAELQTMMDGGLLFKREGNRSFMSAAGLGDVVTHQWVEYQRTGKTLSMGSFALERIR